MQPRAKGLPTTGSSPPVVRSSIAVGTIANGTELEKLLRFISRHQTSMVSSPIPPAGHIPPQFLQTLVDLDAGVTKTVAAEKSATKKMTGAKSKAVTGLRQTIKKKNKEFEGVLATFNEVSLIAEADDRD